MKNFFVFIQAHPFHYHDYRAITAPGPRLTKIIENYPSKALGSPSAEIFVHPDYAF